MEKNNTIFSLKLSKEKIELLFTKQQNQYQEIGSADPNSSDVTKELKALLNQVQSLNRGDSTIDVLLPDELILVQNLSIETSAKPVSEAEARELISKACALDPAEINVAVGVPTSDRTQPVAAVTTKTIEETRHFLNNAGFYTDRFVSSRPINGFRELPIFCTKEERKKALFGGRHGVLVGVIALALFCSLISLVSVLNRFSGSEVNDQLSTKIHSTINFKPLKNIDKNKNEYSSVVVELVPDMEQKQKLQLPIASLTNLPNVGTYFGKISGNPDKRPTISFKMLPKTEQIPNQVAQMDTSKQHILPRFNESPLSASSLSLQSDFEHSYMINQNSQLHKLKSSIQYDYLKSLKPNFTANFDKTAINVTKKLQTQLKRVTNPKTNAEIILKPKLSLLEKIKSKFVPKNSTRKAALPSEIIRHIPSLSTRELFSYQQLNVPKTSLNQDQFIEILNSKSITQQSFLKLSQDRLLLSEKYKPIIRPGSIKEINVLEEPTISSGAVTLSRAPIVRPIEFEKLALINPSDVKIIARATKKPSFPRRASIESNATISDIIELNRTNLIGIFGTKENAIALIRLASGRVIQVRVGDKFDGWRVLGIYKDKIEVANENKQEVLRLPG